MNRPSPPEPLVIAVCAGRTGEGATTTATLLARAAAAYGSVLAVDAGGGDLAAICAGLPDSPFGCAVATPADARTLAAAAGSRMAVVDLGASAAAIRAAVDAGADVVLCVCRDEPDSAAPAYAVAKLAGPRTRIVLLMDGAGRDGFDRIREAGRRFLDRDIVLAATLPGAGGATRRPGAGTVAPAAAALARELWQLQPASPASTAAATERAVPNREVRT